MIYLRKDTSVTKVELTTWKSYPLVDILFVAESKTTARTTTVSQFEVVNERAMGGDVDETWYEPLSNQSTCIIGCIYLQP